MRRRELLKSISGIFGTTLLLPSWASGWTQNGLGEPSLLNSVQKNELAALVETIIPKTDTPGAADLNVHRFVEVMVQDCFDEKGQKQLTQGLDKLDQEAKKQSVSTFSKLDADKRLALVKGWGERKGSEEETFVNSVKNLTIQGYQSSEYYLTNVNVYELVPARYHGCVEIKA